MQRLNMRSWLKEILHKKASCEPEVKWRALHRDVATLVSRNLLLPTYLPTYQPTNQPTNQPNKQTNKQTNRQTDTN